MMLQGSRENRGGVAGVGDLTMKPKDVPCWWEDLQVFPKQGQRKGNVTNGFFYLEEKKIPFFVK